MMSGLATREFSSASRLNPGLTKKYHRYATHSVQVNDVTYYPSYTQKIKSGAMIIPGIQRGDNEAFSVVIRNPNHERIVNGKPQFSLNVLALPKRIEESLNNWKPYHQLQEYIHLPKSDPLWKYPMWSAGIIIMIVTWAVGRSSVLEIFVQSMLVTIAIFVLPALALSRESATLIYILILLIPLLRLGSTGKFHLKFGRLIIIGMGFTLLINWPEEPFKVSNQLFNSGNNAAIRFSIHGVDNPESKSALLKVVQGRIRNAGIPHIIQSTPYSIQGKLTPSGAFHDIRKWLVRIALNTSGAFWYIDAPNNPAFSTAPGPIFPSQHWTLSSTNYPILLQEAKRITHQLNRFPGVWDAHILNGSWIRESHESVWELNDPLVAVELANSQAFDRSATHSKIFHGRKALRGNQLFTKVSKTRTSIRKRDRIYFMDVGHEFRGSMTAVTRLEKYLRNKLPPNIHLNALTDYSGSAKEKIVEKVFILLAFSVLILSFFLSNGLEILELVLSGIALSLSVLSIHHAMDIPLPIRWETYLMIIYLSILWMEFRIIRAKKWLLVLSTTIVLQHFLLLEFRWFLLLAGSILVYRIILLVPKWILTKASPLLPWRDRQFFE